MQSRGLLSEQRDGSFPSSLARGEAITTLLSAITEVDTSVQQQLTKSVVKIIFCVITGMRRIVRTVAICVNNGYNSSRGTIQRDHTRAEQNS